ncbi:MAG: GNAT family N-acetyltransferase [Lysobacterales bacterium]
MSTPVLSAIGTAMTRLGIRAQLFLVVREGVGTAEEPLPNTALECGWLDRKDIEQVHALEPWRSRSRVESWFEKGQRVFGVKDDERLVGRTVCDLANFSMDGLQRPLESDEAYLHSACVDPEYRGRGIAPLMRGACYRALREDGYRRFYSVTKYLNQPARRFKRKLGAIEEALLFYIEFFNRWRWTFTWTLPPGKQNRNR